MSLLGVNRRGRGGTPGKIVTAGLPYYTRARRISCDRKVDHGAKKMKRLRATLSYGRVELSDCWEAHSLKKGSRDGRWHRHRIWWIGHCWGRDLACLVWATCRKEG